MWDWREEPVWKIFVSTFAENMMHTTLVFEKCDAGSIQYIDFEGFTYINKNH